MFAASRGLGVTASYLWLYCITHFHRIGAVHRGTTYSTLAMNYKKKHKCVKKLAFLLIILVLTAVYIYSDYIFVQDFKPNPNLKYILLWTSERTEPFMYIGLRQQGFIERNCAFNNCFVTAASQFFGDYKKFHAVVFAMSEVDFYPDQKLPLYRSPEQKYVFTSIESSHYYPVCSNRFDGFFNWSWSFRLDSDCRWDYIAIRDEQNRIIGPYKNMHWIELKDMRPISADLQKRLLLKTKAAAWFVSNCEAKSHRELYVKSLQKELRKFNLTIDIYGACGNSSCPRKSEECFEMIRNDYYFYLAFENSFSEDYVTEKLLLALKNDAIPIVYGGANYTRFMPDGMYLNARMFGPKSLARTMNYLILNPDKYAQYFKWQNHYSYHYRHESEETDDICAFCKLLNDEVKFKQKSVIENFQKWWDSPNMCDQ